MIVLILPPLEGNAPIDIYIREGNEVKNHSAVEQVQTSPALKKFWKQMKYTLCRNKGICDAIAAAASTVTTASIAAASVVIVGKGEGVLKEEITTVLV